MAEAITRMRIGLSNVVYSLLDESTDVLSGTPSYGTIYQLPGALEMSFDPASSSTTLFADDGPFATGETVGEMKVNFKLADLLQADYARLLGHTYANGIIDRQPTDQSPYVAIGFKALRSGKDGANNVYDYVWLPKVKLSKPKSDNKTKAASIEFKNIELEARVVQLIANNRYHVSLRTDDALASATTITNWFNNVVTSSSADLGALSVAVTANTTKMRYTFTKAGGGNITLTAANLTTNTLPVYKGASAVPQAGTYAITNNGTATVLVDFTPSVAFGTAYVAGTVAANAVYDQNGVYAPAAGAVISF